MGELIPGPKGGKYNRIQKGEVLNPAGRPRKLVTTLKIEGYLPDQIRRTMEKILAMTPEELEKIAKDEKCTALEITLAKSVLQAIPEGNLSVLETIITRAHGKPTQIIESKVDLDAKLAEMDSTVEKLSSTEEGRALLGKMMDLLKKG